MQLSLAPVRFVVIHTAGVIELEKCRPVDILARILEEPLILEEGRATMLQHFFRSCGPAEVAAMCFMLATQLPAGLPQVQSTCSRLDTVLSALLAARRGALVTMSASMCSRRRDPRKASQITKVAWQCTLQAVVQQAKQALNNPRLTGEAIFKEASSTHVEDPFFMADLAAIKNVLQDQGFDMDQVSTAPIVHHSVMSWRKKDASDLIAWQQLQTKVRAAAAAAGSGHCKGTTHVHMADAGCGPFQCSGRQICRLALAD